VPAVRTETGLRLEPPGAGPTYLERAVVESPGKLLRDLTIVDTPPLAGLDAPEDRMPARLAAEADAMVYLVRYPENDQILGLRVSQGSPVQSPVARAFGTNSNSILVLARADEMGAGRIDALIAAKQLARASRRENSLCADFQSVVAVSGQIGYAAKTLTDADFSALGLLAGVPRAELDRFLLSTDAFVAEHFPVELTPVIRRSLLAKFGLPGVRLATTLLRTGSDTQIKLSAQLAQRSGLSDLRETLIMYFADRREVLKVRSGLLAVDSIVRVEPRPHAEFLLRRIEQILANTHDFSELRLISDINSGRVIMPELLSEQALQLCGAAGVALDERLGLSGVDGYTSEIEKKEMLLRVLRDWRRIVEDQSQSPSVRALARVVVRSCEGLFVALEN
jgi:hypothetical protein